MKLIDVQDFILAQLRSDPTLGPTNAFSVFDPFVLQETERAQLNAIIAANGFCIQVDLPHTLPNSSKTNNGGVTFADAVVGVFIAEDRSVPHQPAALLLVNYVEKAINTRSDQRQITGTRSLDPVVDSDGLVIWPLVVTVKVEDDLVPLPVIQAGLTDNAGNPVTDNAGNQISSP